MITEKQVDEFYKEYVAAIKAGQHSEALENKLHEVNLLNISLIAERDSLREKVADLAPKADRAEKVLLANLNLVKEIEDKQAVVDARDRRITTLQARINELLTLAVN